MKRIHKVTIKRMIDEFPDTSSIGEYSNYAKSEYAIDRRHSLDCPINSGIESGECDCGENGDWKPGNYKYYNAPIENYKGEPPQNIRRYVLQGYNRMKSLYAGVWYYISICAEAKIIIGHSIHRITSGGVWSIASDSDKSYLDNIEQEQLAELKDKLLAFGFSHYEITEAFRELKREEN